MSGTTKDKIQRALETKEAIFEAIKEKGVLVPNPSLFSSYPDSIRAIKLDSVDCFMQSYVVIQNVFNMEMPEETFQTSFSSELVV